MRFAYVIVVIAVNNVIQREELALSARVGCGVGVFIREDFLTFGTVIKRGAVYSNTVFSFDSNLREVRAGLERACSDI